MKNINSLIALLLLAGSSYGQTTWALDKAHTKIGFNVTHLAVSEVEGNFKDFEGTVKSKADDFSGAEVTFSAKVASVDTDNEKRDSDLRSPNFFDAEKFPDLTFKGTLTKEGTKYKLSGDLTMHGVTKKVAFDVTYGGTVDTGRGTKAGFKLTGKIDRKEYGLTWANKTPGGELIVGDTVEIICKIEADKKA